MQVSQPHQHKTEHQHKSNLNQCFLNCFPWNAGVLGSVSRGAGENFDDSKIFTFHVHKVLGVLLGCSLSPAQMCVLQHPIKGFPHRCRTRCWQEMWSKECSLLLNLILPRKEGSKSEKSYVYLSKREFFGMKISLICFILLCYFYDPLMVLSVCFKPKGVL